jgi:hypothetical protein
MGHPPYLLDPRGDPRRCSGSSTPPTRKRSIALTSNIHPAGFDELMPKTLAAATVDRLLHHAHVLLTEGTDSYRLAQATAGKGVRPLT